MTSWVKAPLYSQEKQMNAPEDEFTQKDGWRSALPVRALCIGQCARISDSPALSHSRTTSTPSSTRAAWMSAGRGLSRASSRSQPLEGRERVFVILDLLNIRGLPRNEDPVIAGLGIAARQNRHVVEALDLFVRLRSDEHVSVLRPRRRITAAVHAEAAPSALADESLRGGDGGDRGGHGKLFDPTADVRQGDGGLRLARDLVGEEVDAVDEENVGLDLLDFRPEAGQRHRRRAILYDDERVRILEPEERRLQLRPFRFRQVSGLQASRVDPGPESVKTLRELTLRHLERHHEGELPGPPHRTSQAQEKRRLAALRQAGDDDALPRL